MKVTAFIRKTAAKNNITDQARVYFRVRDIGGVDIKAASELSINPNHWSPERQGYKPRVALVSEEKKMAFDKDVQQITHLITKEYHRGVDSSWLKSLIVPQGFLHIIVVMLKILLTRHIDRIFVRLVMRYSATVRAHGNEVVPHFQ